jgi:hypothetical protein
MFLYTHEKFSETFRWLQLYFSKVPLFNLTDLLINQKYALIPEYFIVYDSWNPNDSP